LVPQNLLTQAERYARGSPFNFAGRGVPFLHATNGEALWFHDVRHRLNRSRRVAAFHTPAALQEMLARDFDAACSWLAVTPNRHPLLRPYQVEAHTPIEDTVSSTWLIRGADGKEYKPEDYLAAFARFVQENPLSSEARPHPPGPPPGLEHRRPRRVAPERAEKLTQAILAKAFCGELVPTEAELARREGRTCEPASALLERIRAERDGGISIPNKPKRRRTSKPDRI
jgi:hypothetical protein